MIYPVVIITNILNSIKIEIKNKNFLFFLSRRYNNRYNYSTDHYQQQQQQHQTRPINKTTKRGTSTVTSIDRQQNKQPINNNNNNNLHHQSVSDNEQKEGEEWETASESSANMRNSQQQTIKSTINETKTINRDRTPPKKSFSSQRLLFFSYLLII
jgi:hypothetical protein